MIRTQISLTEEQMVALRVVAERRGVSIAAVVRDAVEAELERAALDDRLESAREVFGAYRSGLDDLGREHDTYLTAAFDDASGR